MSFAIGEKVSIHVHSSDKGRKVTNLGNFFTDPERCADIVGNLKQGEMHHCLLEWMPLPVDNRVGNREPERKRSL